MDSNIYFCFVAVTQKYNNSGNNTKTDVTFLTGVSASHYMKGLLEVEPLHFTCHSTSDGTRVERVDTGEYRIFFVIVYDVNVKGKETVKLKWLRELFLVNVSIRCTIFSKTFILTDIAIIGLVDLNVKNIFLFFSKKVVKLEYITACNFSKENHVLVKYK